MSDKQYDNTNRFAMWKNDGEKADDRDPDYSGTLNVDGQDFFIDGWVSETKAGKKMMSGRIKLKSQARGGGNRPAPRNQGPDDL